MKTGKSLQELAAELDRQNNAKQDYVAPAKLLRMGYDEPGLQLQMGTNGDTKTFSIGDIAHDQISERLGVPRKYYDRMMADAPELLVTNVNHWLATSDDKRMVRTLDGKARAFLSDRYRPMDNFDLMQAVLPALMETGAEVTSCEVTERRVYVKAIVPGMQAEILAPGHEVGKGHNAYDIVQAGIVVANSEVGAGALAISPAMHTVRCTNLAVFNADAMRKQHVGKSIIGDSEANWEVMSDKTKQLSDTALWAQVADLARASLDGRIFERLVAELRRAKGLPIEGDPAETIVVLGKTKGLNDAEQTSILRHLIEGGDLSMYGLHNAVTRASQDVDSYDRASELERMGGQIIELSPTDWKELATA